MIILVKTPTVTFSLDVDPSDKVGVLIKKVVDRTGFDEYQFQLLFAGEPMDYNATVQSHGIRKEGTIHLLLIKELNFDIEYKSVIYNLKLPNNNGLKIKVLKSAIYPLLAENEPTINSMDLRLTQNEKILDDNDIVQKSINRTQNIIVTAVVKGSSGSSSSSPSPDSQQQADQLQPEFNKDEFLSHFTENSISNDVEVVFCFDTTGSMNAVIVEVRKKIEETITRLMKEIPLIRIGIMAMGDYIDSYTLKSIDLTNDVNKLVKFINSVKSTSGGDEPEAYEYALHKAKFMSWSKHTSKAFVMIGDSPPHPPYYSNLGLNWVREVDDLEALGIKIYGVVAIHDRYRFFYQTMSERTGGLTISFSNFELITDMFLAICFRETSSQKYQQFKKEAMEKGGKDLDKIFDDLDKPNFEVANQEIPINSEEQKEKTEEKTEETTTTTTTTTTTESKPQLDMIPKKKVIKKYGYLTEEYPSQCEEWCGFYDLEDLSKKPMSFKTGFFGGFKSSSEVVPYQKPLIGMVIGELDIGYAEFHKAMVMEGLTRKRDLLICDYRLDTLKSIPEKSIFIGAFSLDSKESFDKLSEKLDIVQKQFPKVATYLYGIKCKKENDDPKPAESKSPDTSDATTTTSTTTEVTDEEIILCGRNKNLVLGFSKIIVDQPSTIKKAESQLLKNYNKMFS
eukprot:gene1169-1480_t